MTTTAGQASNNVTLSPAGPTATQQRPTPAPPPAPASSVLTSGPTPLPDTTVAVSTRLRSGTDATTRWPLPTNKSGVDVSDSGDSSLGGAAIAGIIIGCVLLAVCIGGAVVYSCREEDVSTHSTNPNYNHRSATTQHNPVFVGGGSARGDLPLASTGGGPAPAAADPSRGGLFDLNRAYEVEGPHGQRAAGTPAADGHRAPLAAVSAAPPVYVKSKQRTPQLGICFGAPRSVCAAKQSNRNQLDNHSSGAVPRRPPRHPTASCTCPMYIVPLEHRYFSW